MVGISSCYSIIYETVIRRGGQVEVLQELMGHKKLRMSMKYVPVVEEMKQARIARLDQLERMPSMKVS